MISEDFDVQVGDDESYWHQYETVTLRYDPRNPWAVKMHVARDNVWTFARELLFDTGHDTGIADVRVTFSGDSAIMTLTSNEGTCLFRFNRKQVRGFINRTLVRIPRGREEMDVDRVIAKLLTEGH